MSVESFDHVNIRCIDMERTRAFYCDILGLTLGPRPAVNMPGYWLYCGGLPHVHLGAREYTTQGNLPTSNCALDHVAFRLSNPEAMMATLKSHGVPFTERNFPGLGIRQIVVRDPEGILVELNCGALGRSC